MPISCTFCGASQQQFTGQCATCGKSMLVSHQDIEEIKAELLTLKTSVAEKMTHFEAQLSAVEARFDGQTAIAEALTNPIQETPYEDSFNEMYQIEAEFIAQLTTEIAAYKAPKEEITENPELEAPQEESIATTTEEITNEVCTQEEEFLAEETQEAVQTTEYLESENAVPLDEPKPVLHQLIEDLDAQVKTPVLHEDEVLETNIQATTVDGPTFEEIQQQNVNSNTSTGLKELFGDTFFAPVIQFKHYFQEIYFHYKKQNKLPVFFMTIGGILALLFGFGYLMQQADNFYYELAKTLGGFGAAALAILWGKTLTKSHEDYNEFGSAILGLGISLNYLMVYFLSSSEVFSFFSSPAIGLILVLLNTLLAAWLALRFETRIVAVVSLMGGAFAPFYLNSELISPFYFSYLWVLCAGSIYVGNKIAWKPLGTLAFMVATFVMEWVVWQSADQLNLPIFTIIFHAFAYLFMYYALFEQKQAKFFLNREEVFVLAVSISSLLLNLYMLHDEAGSYILLGLTYLANATFMIAAFFALRKSLPKTMQLLFFVLAGTFAGLAVPALFGQEFMALFWAIEGIALITCGFIFEMPSVRKEGYVVALVALGKSLLTWPSMFNNWGTTLWTTGFTNYLTLGVLVISLVFILRKYRNVALKFEQTLYQVLFEGISLWVWGIWAIAGYFYLGNTWYNWGLAPMLLLVWWGNKNQLKFTEWLGLSNFLWPISAVMLSVGEVGSFRFHEQTVLGKIGFIEVFLPLWAMQFFYEKFMPNNANLWLMKVVREVFYIILPWIILSPINRLFPDFLPMGCALAAAISFGLWEILRKQSFIFAKSMIRNQAYLQIALFCVLGFPKIGLFMDSGIWHWGFYNLIAFGFIFGGLRWYLMKVRTEKTAEEQVLPTFILEALSVWTITIYNIIGFTYIPEWTSVFAIFGLFGWTWWASKQKLVFTEILGFAHYLLIIGAMCHQIIEIESVSFIEQSPIGMLLMLESFFLLWGLPRFYKKVVKHGQLQQFIYSFKTLFLLGIPLVALPTYITHFTDAVTIGLWAAAFITFILHEQFQKKSLNLELNSLIAISTIGLLIELSIPTALVGLALIFGIYFYKKGYLLSPYLASDEEKKQSKSPYRHLFSYAFYFLGLNLSLLYGKLMLEAGGMLLMAGLYFYGITYFRKHIHALRSNYRFAYRLGNTMMVLGLLWVLLDSFSHIGQLHDSASLKIGVIILGISALVLQGILTYKRSDQFSLVQDDLLWKAEVVFFQLLTIVAYTGFIHLISENWDGVVLTVCLTLHAIILLFNSANPKYKFLMRFSIALFVGTAIKLKFLDMANMGTTYQIVVLMIVGVLLLLGANLFARFRKRWITTEVAE